MIKAGMNAADDGLAGVQQLAGDATMLFYMSEEGQEGRNAFVEHRPPTSPAFPSAHEHAVALWVAGARPRTFPAAIVPVAVGTAVGYRLERPPDHCHPGSWRIGQCHRGPGAPPQLDQRACAADRRCCSSRSGRTTSTTTPTACVARTRSRVGPVRLVAGGSGQRARRQDCRPDLLRDRRPGRAVPGRRWSAGGSFPSASSAGWPDGPTPADRTPTGTWAWARSSCSSSSGWWPRPGRPTSSTRPSPWPSARTVYRYHFDWAYPLWAGVPVGLLAVALLEANNMRDIDTDTVAGKRTLAVRLGRRNARPALPRPAGRSPPWPSAFCIAGTPGPCWDSWPLPLALYPIRIVLSDRTGRAAPPAARRHGAPSDRRRGPPHGGDRGGLRCEGQPVTDEPGRRRRLLQVDGMAPAREPARPPPAVRCGPAAGHGRRSGSRRSRPGPGRGWPGWTAAPTAAPGCPCRPAGGSRPARLALLRLRSSRYAASPRWAKSGPLTQRARNASTSPDDSKRRPWPRRPAGAAARASTSSMPPGGADDDHPVQGAVGPGGHVEGDPGAERVSRADHRARHRVVERTASATRAAVPRKVGPHGVRPGVAGQVDADEGEFLGQQVTEGAPQARRLGEAVQQDQGRPRPAHFDMERHGR